MSLICTLFTGQSSKEGIFMRYTYEFKLTCVDLYRQGRYPETPKGLSDRDFHKQIRRWVRTAEKNGDGSLRPRTYDRIWTADEKYELVAQVLAGKSCSEVGILNEISSGLLSQWVRKYKELGYNGLETLKKGRPVKEPEMKKNVEPKPLSESEREELIRLRAEVEYIKAENAVIKKRIALRQEKAAAQLKAKKQRSSKNSEKKDIN